MPSPRHPYPSFVHKKHCLGYAAAANRIRPAPHKRRPTRPPMNPSFGDWFHTDSNNRHHSRLLPRYPMYYRPKDRKSTRLNSSHVKISYAVFCLKKKNKKIKAIDIATVAWKLTYPRGRLLAVAFDV